MFSAKEIIHMYGTIDPDLIKDITEEYKKEYQKKYPEIDFSKEENVDFIIRPVVAATILSELNKDMIQSLSTIDGIVKSELLTDHEKEEALKKYAINLGFTPKNTEWKLLYKEIIYFVKNNWYNLKTPVTNLIFKNHDEITKVYIADLKSKEMARNKIPLIQFPDYLTNNWKKDETNIQNLIGASYSRKDVNNYQKAISNGYIEMPNFIDVYMFTDIEDIELTVSREKKEDPFILEERYYILVESDKGVVIINNVANDFMYGIIKRKLEVHIEDYDGLEATFKCKVYPFSNIEDINDFIVTANILYKGFFPLFLDMVIYTEKNIDKEEMLNKIKDYFKECDYSFYKINFTDLNNRLGEDIIISGKISGKLYLSPNLFDLQDFFMPFSENDLNLSKSFLNRQITKDTIVAIPNNIEVMS